ncbi:MAG: sugar transporter substrate-binding protein [Symbiobacteriaceae bacterium]|jgi:multiple sugar transport system substrate-binding protein|nr:sugar transporter substrate-binding protein [Symbiobacteriaceae bacterium]
MHGARSALLSLIAMLVAAGCSSVPKAPPVSTVDPPAPAEVTTIRVALPGGESTLLTEHLIPAFEAEHSNYRVEAVSFEKVQSLKDAIAKREVDVVPSVWFSPAEIPLFTRPLDSYVVKSKLDESPYDGLLDGLARDGRTYELPYVAYIGTFVYNPEMTKAAGVTIPADAWTWDEFRAAAARLKGNSGGTKVWGVDTHEHELLLELWVEGKTGRPVWEANLSTLREAIGFFHTMVFTDETLVPAPVWEITANSITAKHSRKRFEALTTGRAAMAFEWSDIRRLSVDMPEVKWDMAPMPHVPGAKPVLPVVLRSLGITTSSTRPDAAWDFIAFATGPAGAEVVARAGFAPPYRSEETHRAWKENQQGYPPGVESIWSATWWDSWNTTTPRDQSAIRDFELSKAQNWALSGQKSIDEALAWLAAHEKGQ